MIGRAEEIRGGLAGVRERIVRSAAEAARDPATITLVVVTKNFPSSDVRILADLGVRDVGENRHQEAEAKAAELEDLRLRWHFVGNLQSNKAAAVAQYADVVHSVDRAKLLGGLSRGAHYGGRTLDCLVQVDLDQTVEGGAKAGRGGAAPDRVPALCAAVEAAEGLRLKGLMAVAPVEAEPAAAFASLAALSRVVRREHASASWLSAGMSGDLEAAIAAGATHVRVGSAVLGQRRVGG